MLYSKKRTRSIYNADSISTPSQWHHKNHPTDMIARSGDLESPLPFVNTRYELAGGSDLQEDECDYNFDGRREGLQRRGRQDCERATYNLPSVPTDANGRLRSPNRSKGNGFLSNVISKVWEFATGTLFRGFGAGGGETFPTQSKVEAARVRYENTHDEYSQMATPVPGCYPAEDFMEAHYSLSPNQTSPRPAKRRQIGNEEGVDKWVIVPEAGSTSAQRISCRIPRPSLPQGHTTRRSVYSSRVSAVSHFGSPSLPASFASPRSFHSRPRGSTTHSPASIEARNWAAKKQKEDEETDESIRRFNAKLQAMIKEGQEALGTKIDYEDGDEEMEDEGFVSGGNGW